MKFNTLPILLATTFLSTSAMAITPEPTLENSAISYSEGNSSDYNFKIQEADANGNLTTKYYKINLDKDKFSTSSSTSWTELDSKPDDMTNVVEVKLPNNQAKYFKYTYATPSGYETITESENISVVNPTDQNTYKYVGAAINNASGNDYGDINEKVFLSNKVTANLENNTYNYKSLVVYGGVISNQGEIGKVIADFIDSSIEATFNGKFSSTYAYGGAISNYANSTTATIGDITGDFIGNYVSNPSEAYGGAIYNYASSSSSTATIGNITGDFIGNYAGDGGAIFNYAYNSSSTATIGNITGDFIGNYAGDGGAISNYAYNSSSTATIGNITGDFIGNNSGGQGGAIYNRASSSTATIDNITGNFIGNYVSASSSAYGGAISNYAGGATATIGDITGDFIGNYASGNYAYSGAISNYASSSSKTATIGDITGDFISNYASGNYAYGGAIYNYANSTTATIGDITGEFIGNYVSSSSNAAGGAIYNYASSSSKTATIGDITGDFIGNYVSSSSNAYGGAIYNYAYNSSKNATIGDITGEFIGNYVSSSSNAYGGAIYNYLGKIGNISGNFLNNYAKTSSDTKYALGGAIYTSKDLTFKADGETYLFSGNYTEDSRGKINNAIWVNNSSTPSHPILTFNIINGGIFVFDDEIDGGYLNNNKIIKDDYSYNLNITGDVCESCFANSITFNDRINNVHDLSLDTTQMVLGKNAYIEVTNNYIAQASNDGKSPLLRVEVDLKDGKAGQLFVDGNIYGKTSVIVDTKNYRDVRGEEGIVFAQSNGDIYLDGENGAKAETIEEKAQAFSIFRVVGSPYMWDIEYENGGVENIWSLVMNGEENTYTEDCDETPEGPEPVIPDEPTPDEPIQPLGPIQVAPEVVATVAVKTAGLSQTNGMVYNIMRKVGINHLYCQGCGFYDYNWDGKPLHNVWVDTTYNGLTIESPVEIEAKVWGIEAGADIQQNIHNKLGIFVSYRQGNYEMDGKGEKYYSTIGSEIDIDSYLAGLYYRYDKNNWYAFATVYGGMQNAEIKTDDGITTDTDGIEFGGSIEAGYNYALTRKLSVTPSLGAFYSQISYDDATDNVGKTVNYNDLKQVELEAGAKFAYTQYTDDGFYSLYVKPSVVQTLIDGDEIEVTKLGKVDTVEDKTLGRVEIGGNYGFNENWSGYGWANYTFGSDYEATSLGLGLNYAW